MKKRARPCCARANSTPFYPMQQALSAHAAFLAHDYKSGLEFAEQATAVGPAFWISYFQLALVHERLGNYEPALKALTDAEALSGGNSKIVSLRGYILAKQGRTNDAEECTARIEEHRSREVTCRPTRLRLCTPDSTNAMRPSRGSTAPSTRGTCIWSG